VSHSLVHALRFSLLGAAFLAACGQGSSTGRPVPTAAAQTPSSPIAVSPDGTRLYVVHPDADSVSAVDPAARTIVWETLLASQAPAAKDPGSPACTGGGIQTGADVATSLADCAYTPSVMPRALALDPTGTTLYVTGERNGTLGAPPGVADSGRGLVYALDASTGSLVKKSAPVCSEPAGILVDATGSNLFVACSNDDAIAELRTSDLSLVAEVSCPHKPWALSWAADGKTLLATHLLGSAFTPIEPSISDDGLQTAVSLFTTDPLALTTSWSIPDVIAQSDPTIPNGLARGIYDAVARPGTDELWVAHSMLASSTSEPSLVFNTTVFPCISIFDPSGNRTALLTVSVRDGGPSEGGSGVGGAFADVVSGPQSITFSLDGRYAFVVDANSEDVLVIDAVQRAELLLVRPLPGHWPVGAVFSPGGKLYVTQRNTEDLAVIDVTEMAADASADAYFSGDASLGPAISAVVEGATIPTLLTDPMPAVYRLGQQIFNSANSDEFAITTNHWVACASCHIEQRTDAITWRFLVGPRDTPSNAGGTIGTGFLLHTADRREVADYWRTIDEEQGGIFAMNATQTPLLDALQTYVNYAIPIPVPPTTNPALVAQGEKIFATAGCTTCHTGAFKTDSGCGNPTLDLSGPEVSVCMPGGVLVHDVGTCNTGAFPDVNHTDMNGDARNPCAFDAPALRGLWDASPYMHDGSALNLDDAVDIMILAAAKVGGWKTITTSQKAALVEYLKSL
jgi:DNA-binding beta-propeller fold protein YncE